MLSPIVLGAIPPVSDELEKTLEQNVYCKLAGDGREYALGLVAQRNQYGDGDHGDEDDNQGGLRPMRALWCVTWKLA